MKKFAFLGFVVFLFGCGSAPVPRQIQNAFPIEKPFDSVWQATIETFSDLNLSIMNMEKASGLITTDWISFSGQKNETGYCDCGSTPLMFTEQDRAGKFNVYIKTITADSCEIRLNAIFEQTCRSITNPPSYQKRKCNSTGKLEADMFKLISEKVK